MELVVKKPLLVQETQETQEAWVWSLGREGPLEEKMAARSSILAWRILMDRGALQVTAPGVSKNWTQPSTDTCDLEM